MRRRRKLIPAPRPESAARLMCAARGASTMLAMTTNTNTRTDGLAVRTQGLGKRFGDRAALESVDLFARAADRFKSYARGMRQGLGVARCWLGDPELLTLDEPLNGLDPAGILEMRGLIRDLVAEGRSVLLSSHLLDEVEKTCD